MTSGKKKSKTSKKPSTKVSNQLPRSRRVKVEKALEKKENPLGSLKSKKKAVSKIGANFLAFSLTSGPQ